MNGIGLVKRVRILPLLYFCLSIGLLAATMTPVHAQDRSGELRFQIVDTSSLSEVPPQMRTILEGALDSIAYDPAENQPSLESANLQGVTGNVDVIVSRFIAAHVSETEDTLIATFTQEGRELGELVFRIRIENVAEADSLSVMGLQMNYSEQAAQNREAHYLDSNPDNDEYWQNTPTLKHAYLEMFPLLPGDSTASTTEAEKLAFVEGFEVNLSDELVWLSLSNYLTRVSAPANLNGTTTDIRLHVLAEASYFFRSHTQELFETSVSLDPDTVLVGVQPGALSNEDVASGAPVFLEQIRFTGVIRPTPIDQRRTEFWTHAINTLFGTRDGGNPTFADEDLLKVTADFVEALEHTDSFHRVIEFWAMVFTVVQFQLSPKGVSAEVATRLSSMGDEVLGVIYQSIVADLSSERKTGNNRRDALRALLYFTHQPHVERPMIDLMPSEWDVLRNILVGPSSDATVRAHIARCLGGARDDMSVDDLFGRSPRPLEWLHRERPMPIFLDVEQIAALFNVYGVAENYQHRLEIEDEISERGWRLVLVPYGHPYAITPESEPAYQRQGAPTTLWGSPYLNSGHAIASLSNMTRILLVREDAYQEALSDEYAGQTHAQEFLMLPFDTRDERIIELLDLPSDALPVAMFRYYTQFVDKPEKNTTDLPQEATDSLITGFLYNQGASAEEITILKPDVASRLLPVEIKNHIERRLFVTQLAQHVTFLVTLAQSPDTTVHLMATERHQPEWVDFLGGEDELIVNLRGFMQDSFNRDRILDTIKFYIRLLLTPANRRYLTTFVNNMLFPLETAIIMFKLVERDNDLQLFGVQLRPLDEERDKGATPSDAEVLQAVLNTFEEESMVAEHLVTDPIPTDRHPLETILATLRKGDGYLRPVNSSLTFQSDVPDVAVRTLLRQAEATVGSMDMQELEGFTRLASGLEEEVIDSMTTALTITPISVAAGLRRLAQVEHLLDAEHRRVGRFHARRLFASSFFHDLLTSSPSQHAVYQAVFAMRAAATQMGLRDNVHEFAAGFFSGASTITPLDRQTTIGAACFHEFDLLGRVLNHDKNPRVTQEHINEIIRLRAYLEGNYSPQSPDAESMKQDLDRIISLLRKAVARPDSNASGSDGFPTLTDRLATIAEGERSRASTFSFDYQPSRDRIFSRGIWVPTEASVEALTAVQYLAPYQPIDLLVSKLKSNAIIGRR